MKRFLPSVLAISSVLALAATAGAEDRNHQGRHEDRRPEQRRHGFGTWGGISDSFKKHHGPQQNPKHNPIPIDPGRGDGRVPVDPVPSTPPANPAPRDGFVWVNGHWERAQAAPQAVNPYPAGTTVRDHRATTGGVTVRDHRTTPVVRDHRTTTGSSPAGATVRDHRTSTGNTSGGVTVTVITPSAAKDAPVIRDHRTTPVIRDHRTTSR